MSTVNLQVNANTSGAVGAFNALLQSINQTQSAFNNLNVTIKAGAASNQQYGASISNYLTSAFSRLWSLANSTYAVLERIGAVARFAFDSILKELDKIQGFQAIMSVSLKNTEAVAQSYNFLRQTADRLGVQFDALTSNYAKLVASMPQGVKSLQDAEHVFLGVAMAARTLHATNQDTQLMFYAVTQMASKGVVSMEELRRQLGEKLPGTLEIAAKAVGATTAELEAAIRKGIVDSLKFLPVFGDALIRQFADSSVIASNSVSSAVYRLTNVWVDFVKSILDSGAGQAIIGVFDALREKLSDPYVIARFSELIKSVATRITEFISKLTADDLKNGFDSTTRLVNLLVTALGKLIEAIDWIINNAGKAGAIIGAIAGASTGATLGTAFGPKGMLVGGGIGATVGALGGAYAGWQLRPSGQEILDRNAQSDAARKTANDLIAAQERFRLTVLEPLLINFKGINATDVSQLFSPDRLNQATADAIIEILSDKRFATDQARSDALVYLSKTGVVPKAGSVTLADVLRDKSGSTGGASKLADPTNDPSFRYGQMVLEKLEDNIKSANARWKEYQATVAAVEAHSAKLARTQEDQRDQLAATVSELRDENFALRNGEGALLRRQISLLRLQAEEAEWNAQMQGGNQILLQQAQLLREQANLLESNASLKAAQDAAKQLQAEYERSFEQIGQSLTDALMEGGKSAAQYITSLFRTIVLRPIVQAIVAPIAGIVSGPAMAAGGAGGFSNLGALGQLGSVWNSITSGFSALGNSIAFAAEGLGQWLVMNTSGVLNSAGGWLMSNSGAIGTAGSYLGGIGAGIGIGSLIAGDYKIGSIGGATASTIGSVIGAIGGPIGAAIGGTIGGLVARLFGRKLQDWGITGKFDSTGDFTGRNYKFYKGGLFASDKTKYSEMDPEMAALFDAGAAAVNAQIRAYVDVLGLPADALDGFTQKIKLSLKNLSPEEAQAKIQKLFENLAEGMAERYAPFIEQFQKAGESALETLTRLTAIQEFSNTINDLGGVFAEVARLSIDARESLIEMAGGLEALMQKTMYFVQNYFSREEIAGLKANEILKNLTDVGIDASGIASTADYRALVESLDVSTESGLKQFNELLTLAPAFADIAAYLAEVGGTLGSAAQLAPLSSNLAPLFQLQTDQEQITAINAVTDSVDQAVGVLTEILDAVRGNRVTVQLPEVNLVSAF